MTLATALPVVISQSSDWLDPNYIRPDRLVDLLVLPSLSLLVVDHRGPLELMPGTIRQLIGQRRLLHLHPDISRTFNLMYYPAPGVEGDWHIGIAASIPASHKAELYATTLPDGFRLHLLGSGEYARVRIQGGEAGLGVALNWLINDWLPASGYEPGEGICLFERVQFPPFVEPENALVDILVPVEPR
ncbi:GyrI-like domain-containing protein [Candidatus Thalassolituus haligoni]|uniref:AraC family transcriptional regulator n=1 Tax=Candidatus Thalassolituus haligoni TaxID=3100113 RepID=UPI003515E517|tara:strand:+ start:25473 stop:26036 length:564 start_codon:yes stop_codon:yes gene_type:complete